MCSLFVVDIHVLKVCVAFVVKIGVMAWSFDQVRILVLQGKIRHINVTNMCNQMKM